jgi:hypothetical protein
MYVLGYMVDEEEDQRSCTQFVHSFTSCGDFDEYILDIDMESVESTAWLIFKNTPLVKLTEDIVQSLPKCIDTISQRFDHLQLKHDIAYKRSRLTNFRNARRALDSSLDCIVKEQEEALEELLWIELKL